ncbi:lipoyl(octanoyl) transferase LipB [Arthrobacter sp. H35-D1]|uniref:lipoyl(octanoyl) transferase LipB n=1 Tax=Arthrobacter sp. H35-D1 TaxID=3046202 RepID=UPI0024BAE401|nr:lipoyl(octanoyl) transferase LipB [Arthrobacter sp. H35-D1]MDJ0313211.1 lipoyl(octanoyl) transferase LipB [Arthrobacter sp. H35-D1]
MSSKVSCMTVEFCEVGFAPNFIDYNDAWEQQRQVHADVVAGKSPHTALLLEHAPVYTAGKRTEDHERPFDGTPVINVDRGGKLTWHGPGQLVMYPIVRLADAHSIRAYVHALEDIIIEVLGHCGVVGVRVDGRAGIWLPADDKGGDRKIAAIGIRVHDGVTMHGIAINANNSLDPYAQIIACGIQDAGTTTLQAETGKNISPQDLVPLVKDATARFLAPLIAETQPEQATTAGSAKAAQSEGALL